MFTVKCFNDHATVYECQIKAGVVDAVILAQLLAETYGSGYRSNVYKLGETTHFYSVSGNMDITQRCFS